jgi:hypothetical protein
LRDAAITRASDLDEVRPRRTGASGSAKRPKARKAGSLAALMRRLRSRAIMVIATSCFCAIMVGIVLNATVFQKGHHPAPLVRPAAVAASVPQPPVRPQAALVPVPPPPAPVAPEAVPQEPLAPPVHAHPAPPKHAASIAVHKSDAIAQLINQGSRQAGEPAKPAAAHDHRRPGSVRAAQNAKAKPATPGDARAVD